MPGPGRRFQPGQSGNPNGRPKVVAEIQELAREHSTLAIETLATIVGDEKVDARARVAAANALLDRGYGKPSQSFDLNADRKFESIEIRVPDFERTTENDMTTTLKPNAESDVSGVVPDTAGTIYEATQNADASRAEVTALDGTFTLGFDDTVTSGHTVSNLQLQIDWDIQGQGSSAFLNYDLTIGGVTTPYVEQEEGDTGGAAGTHTRNITGSWTKAEADVLAVRVYVTGSDALDHANIGRVNVVATHAAAASASSPQRLSLGLGMGL